MALASYTSQHIIRGQLAANREMADEHLFLLNNSELSLSSWPSAERREVGVATTTDVLTTSIETLWIVTISYYKIGVRLSYALFLTPYA